MTRETTPPLRGRVICRHAKKLHVQTEQGLLRCELSGTLRRDRRRAISPVAVGDEVEVFAGGPGEGVIRSVLPRHSRLSRQSVGRRHEEQIVVANIDRVVVVTTLLDPPLDRLQLDRILLAVEARDLPLVLCCNKVDLTERAEVEERFDAYRRAGYEFLITSAVTGEGIEDLRRVLQGRVSVFFGPSGVGKSHLLNALEPGLGLKVGDLQEANRKGRHTTTWVELHPLGTDGFVADTPGVEVLELWQVPPEDLASLFPEFADLSGECRFRNCRHDREPDCAVSTAVEEGTLDRFRHASYRKVLRDLQSRG